MEKYRELFNFVYKNKRFKILVNDKHQKYFLKILDDNSLIYPDLEEFAELYKIFNKDIKEPNVFCMIKNDESNHRIFKFIPKVIRKGMLISLASAMITTGCSDKNINQIPDAVVRSESTALPDKADTLDEIEDDILDISPTEEEIEFNLEMLSRNRIGVEFLKNENMYVVRSAMKDRKKSKIFEKY